MSLLTPAEQIAIWVILGIAVLGLAYALFLRNQILREDKGTEKMQEVWHAIRDGAVAYLTSQTKIIMPFILVLTVLLFFSVYIVPVSEEAMQRFAGMPRETVRLIMGFGRAASFILGSLFSLAEVRLVCGWRWKGMSGWHRPRAVLLVTPCVLPIAPARLPACSPTALACWAARSSL